MIDELLRQPPFALPQSQKDALLFSELTALTRRHMEDCPAYGRWVRAAFPAPAEWRSVDDLPYLPVGVFKSHDLVSVPEAELIKTISSSGTTGQVRSRVRLDRPTADRQARALTRIMQALTGPRRLPMLIMEAADLLRDRAALSARAAGVAGMMQLGRDHTFALAADGGLDVDAVRGFLERHRGGPVLLFGFTFMIWRHFLPAAAAAGLRFGEDALLVHGGGWKALAAEAVDDRTFRARLNTDLGLGRVHDFYGMAEQVGSIFLQGEDGWLHPPLFADVIIRDPADWRPLPPGQVGVIQVLSLLPASYPGHSLLTEDLGVVHAVDAGSWGGKAFSVLGRVPRAEPRGCSDTYALGMEGRP